MSKYIRIGEDDLQIFCAIVKSIHKTFQGVEKSPSIDEF